MAKRDRAGLAALLSGTALLALIALWGSFWQLRLGHALLLTVSMLILIVASHAVDPRSQRHQRPTKSLRRTTRASSRQAWNGPVPSLMEPDCQRAAGEADHP
jgi:hypothetical protein